MKYAVITVVCFFFIIGKISAQVIDFDVKVTETNNNLINITITMSNNNYAKSISLWDKEPWNNGKEIESVKNIQVQVYTFENLKKENYIVMVTDTKGDTGGKPANLLDKKEQ